MIPGVPQLGEGSAAFGQPFGTPETPSAGVSSHIGYWTPIRDLDYQNLESALGAITGWNSPAMLSGIQPDPSVLETVQSLVDLLPRTPSPTVASGLQENLLDILAGKNPMFPSYAKTETFMPSSPSPAAPSFLGGFQVPEFTMPEYKLPEFTMPEVPVIGRQSASLNSSLAPAWLQPYNPSPAAMSALEPEPIIPVLPTLWTYGLGRDETESPSFPSFGNYVNNMGLGEIETQRSINYGIQERFDFGGNKNGRSGPHIQYDLVINNRPLPHYVEPRPLGGETERIDLHQQRTFNFEIFKAEGKKGFRYLGRLQDGDDSK